MLTPPDGLTHDVLGAALAGGWQISSTSLAYRPLGWGSHHWEAVDGRGDRWFVTVDDLAAKRWSVGEPVRLVYDRLRASLAVASGLREHGNTFAVAPVLTRHGEPLARLDDRFSVAVYPFVEGRRFDWGDYSSPAHRRAVLDMVVAVHTAASDVRRHAMVDDFDVPHRDELSSTLHGAEVAEVGPYARRTAELLARNAAPVRRLLDRYDELARAGRDHLSRSVLTHGEPHPGNTMLAADGWRLIDWDTALVAPPERDLWTLDPGDGSILDAYAEATGVSALPSLLELYRVRWEVADIAAGVSRFRASHPGGPEDDQSWRFLVGHLEHLT